MNSTSSCSAARLPFLGCRFASPRSSLPSLGHARWLQLLLLALCLGPLARFADAAPPPNFAVEDVLLNLEQPMSMRFLPDGRLLVAQKKGTIRILDTSTTPATAAVYINLAAGTHAHGITANQERGLLDFALDPNFPAQPYLYVLYTPSSGPDGQRTRVARFTHQENGGGLASRLDPASEVILWQDTDGYDSCCHYGGGIDFGPDGKLWITIGDHFQGSYAASLEHAGGSVIRINKDGSIPADNPWVDGAGPNHDALFAIGLRNPFRARWDLVTGRFYIGEVGGNEQAIAWEDLHVIEYDAGTGRFIDADFGTASDNGVYDGIDFGWPTVEGLPPHTDFPGAQIEPIAEPIFAYRHNDVTAAINGGVVYRGSQFPAEYTDAYFYADSTRDFIRYLKFNPDGSLAPNPNPAPIDELNPDELSYPFDLLPTGRIVSLEVGPDGALYYLSFTDQGGAYGVPNPTVLGAVRRYVYDAGNARPIIGAYTATPPSGDAPLPIELTFSATDPEGDPMTYTIDFGDGTNTGDPQPLLDDTPTVVSHTYTLDGVYHARLDIFDGTSVTSQTLTIEVGIPPVITSLTATNHRAGGSDSSFQYGDTFTFAATATDAEDGALSGASFTWTVSFVRPGNVHPALGPDSGTTSVEFPIPAQGQGFSGPVYYSAVVTVTDSSGLSATQSIDIFPEKSNITFNTSPQGIVVQVDGNTAQAAPFVLDTLINLDHTISVPPVVCVDGTEYVFQSWSNGPTSAQQEFNVPETDTTLTATFVPVGPCAEPPSDGLVMHLTAEAGVVLNGSNVAIWEDQSPSGNHLTALGTPTLVETGLNGQSYLHFDGGTDALARTGFTGLATGAQPRSMFMFVRYNEANNTTNGWAGFAYGTRSQNQAFGLALTPTGNLGVQAWGGSFDFAANPPVDGTGDWLMQGVVYDGSTATLYRDGTSLGTASRSYATGTTEIRLAEELGGGKNLNMDVAEILVYNRVLTPSERELVHEYLQTKYAPGGGSGSAPEVTITAPGDNDFFTTDDMPITLTGTATDAEDGNLSAQIEWTSSIDGPLGTGASIQASLSVGTHAITASVVDDDEEDGQDMVTVIVTSVGGGTPPPVTSGLVLHLESDLNVATGTGNSVAGWLDQSGLGNDLVAGGTPELVADGSPTGKPVIRLNGSDLLERVHAVDPLGGLPTGNTNRTMFVVAKYNSTTWWGGVTYGSGVQNQAWGLSVKHPSGELVLTGWGGANDLVSTTPGVGAGWLVQTGLLNSGVATLYKDGAQIAQFNHAYNTTLTRLAIGVELKDKGHIAMDVAAVLLYDRALSPSERAQIETYLTNKYIGGGSSNSAPTVSITAPDDGTAYAPGATVQLTATASDPEDGNLSSSITWTSSIDGNLGTGASINTSSLGSGTHTITASVEDGGGLSDSDSITIRIGTDAPVTSGLVLHLDADVGVTLASGAVTGWADLSPAGNHVTGYNGVQRIGSATQTGGPALRLDGVNDRLERLHASDPLNGFPTGNGNRTLFVVARYTSTTWWGGVAYGNGASNQAFGVGVKHPSGELFLQGFGKGNDLVSTAPGLGAGWLVQTGLLNSGTATLFKDGSQVAQFSHNYATTLNRFVIGEEIKNLGSIGMDVAAVLLYDRALSPAERTQVEGYLQNKYFSGTVSNQAPTVTITAPADGVTIDAGDSIQLTATATDPEDGNLTSSITWTSDLSGNLGTGGSLNVTLSQGTHTITAAVTDSGSASDNDEITVTVTVPGNAAPTVSISAPADNSSHAQGSSITFTATATDPEDGNIAASLEWTSDRDGEIGTGASFSTSALSAGTHIITATALDDDDAVGTDAITITVTAPSSGTLTVTDGLVLHLEATDGVVTSSGNVTAWNDLSPGGNDLTGLGGITQVTSPSGAPALRLDGVNDSFERIHTTDPLTGFPDQNEDRTLIAVVRYTSTTWWGGVAYGSSVSNRTFGIGVKHPTGELYLQGYGGANDLVSTTDGVGEGWLIQSGRLEDGVATLQRNGTSVASWSHNYNTNLRRLVIGRDMNATGFIGMDVAAVLLYDRALSPAEQAEVEAYLADKYL